MTELSSTGKPGVNIVAHVSGNLGMGIAARNLVDALIEADFAVSLLDVDPGHGRKGRVNDLAAHAVASADDLPHEINLFVLGPQVIANEVLVQPDLVRLLTRTRATNAAFTFWELPVLPKGWIRALEVFDMIAASSPYVGGTLDLCLSGTHVSNALLPITLPVEVAVDRARFKLPPDAFVAVLSFDPLSDLSRKNPMGAIEAFRRAFPHEPNVRLVLRANLSGLGGSMSPSDDPFLRDLTAHAQRDARICVIKEALSYSEVLSLYASADAFLSLHRSEGFGLGLLEAMGLGKPVIATGWSGNKAFMSSTCSCMVKYQLRAVAATNWAYVTSMRDLKPFWAEPDIDDAALWLRRLAADAALRTRIGNAAREAFDRYRSAAATLGFMDEILAIRDHHLAAADQSIRIQALHQHILCARRQVRRDSMSTAGWAAQWVSEYFDRHLGWRLKKQLAAGQ